MIKARLKLDSTAIANEITSRFDASSIFELMDDNYLYDNHGNPLFDTDDLSNIVNATVKEYMDELDGQNLGLG